MIYHFKKGCKDFEYEYSQHGTTRVCVHCGDKIMDINRMDHVKCLSKRKRRPKYSFNKVMKTKREHMREQMLIELAELPSKIDYFKKDYIDARIRFLQARLS